MIGYYHDTVVCPSVSYEVYCMALTVGVYGVESFTIVFLEGHFLSTCSDTFAVEDSECQRSAKNLTGNTATG